MRVGSSVNPREDDALDPQHRLFLEWLVRGNPPNRRRRSILRSGKEAPWVTSSRSFSSSASRWAAKDSTHSRISKNCLTRSG